MLFTVFFQPRTDITEGTYSLPPRPSVEDFLDFSEVDQDIALKSPNLDPAESIRLLEECEKESRKSLLELLSADTARTGTTENTSRADWAMTNNSDQRLTSSKPEASNIVRQTSRDIPSWNTNKKLNNNNSLTNSDKTKPPINKSLNPQRSFGKQKSESVSKANVRSSSRTSPVVPVLNVGIEDIEQSLQYKTDDYLIFQRDNAARKIQRWYKRSKIRKTAGAAAMKRMLNSKREMMEARRSMERNQVILVAYLDIPNFPKKR